MVLAPPPGPWVGQGWYSRLKACQPAAWITMDTGHRHHTLCRAPLMVGFAMLMVYYCLLWWTGITVNG
jgi:hypothetical protein